MTTNDEVIDLLTRLWDYMDNKADVDWDGNYEVWKPNEEMVLKCEIDELLKKL